MLVLNEDFITQNMVLTLTEKVTLAVPFFLFVFTNVSTRQVVTFNAAVADDTSSAPSRYNQFAINTQAVFANQAAGQWQYKVYESAVATTDPTGLNLLENGKMLLQKAAPITINGYKSTPTYVGYAG